MPKIEADSSKLRSNILLMRPTGQISDQYPVFEIIPDSSNAYNRVYEIATTTFVGEAIDLYFLAQQHLYKNGEISSIEPVYLALTKNEGGFAKLGFFLKSADSLIDKAHVPYIDIVENRIYSSLNRLMSFTQLYPHEMGHLIYRMLKPERGDHSSKCVDMHYFSVSTDYSIAFNEGFAEHIENVSRRHEKNDSIRSGIRKHRDVVSKKSSQAIRGFTLDLAYPFRMGYYKLTMPLWYQQYENYKRFVHANQARAKYPNSYPASLELEDQFTYRNAGIRKDSSRLLNYAQLLSTEGVISSFFTKLTESKAGLYYQPVEFYQPFYMDSITGEKNLRDLLPPWKNQFLKYFSVFHRYMPDSVSTGSAFIDFLNGYLAAFPGENRIVHDVFREATGRKLIDQAPTQIWLMVKGQDHRIIVPDPYGALTIPVYTFNLNAADELDLRTIGGVTPEIANAILDYRDRIGSFENLDQIHQMNEIPDEIKEKLYKATYDEEYMSGIEMPALSFSSLLITPVKALLLRSLIYFAVFWMIFYFLFVMRSDLTGKGLAILSVGNLVKWLFMAFSTLLFVVLFPYPWMPVVILVILLSLTDLLIYRKRIQERNWALTATLIMGTLLIPSLI